MGITLSTAHVLHNTISGSDSLLAWIIHEITYAARPNPSAPPIFANEAVANSAQTARPGRQYSLYCAPCLHGPPKSATGKGFGRGQPSGKDSAGPPRPGRAGIS